MPPHAALVTRPALADVQLFSATWWVCMARQQLYHNQTIPQVNKTNFTYTNLLQRLCQYVRSFLLVDKYDDRRFNAVVQDVNQLLPVFTNPSTVYSLINQTARCDEYSKRGLINTSKVLRHDKRSQFYLPPNTSHTCLYSQAAEHHCPLAGTQCTYPWRDGQAELTWMPGYIIRTKFPVPWVKPG